MKKRKFKFFRNAIIFIQSFVLLLTCTSPVFALPLNKSNLIFNVKAKTAFKDLNTTNKSAINNAIKTFNVDGVATAKSINKIEDKEAFEIGVRKVLDKYYSTEKSKRGELNDFAKTIDSSATYILENYKEAEAERENQENLPFEAEEVIVSFPYGTPMETIETIVGNEAVSYELIDDGRYEIPEELPDYKKERLKVLEDVRNDIVILANISLEDTVKRASEKFDEYSLVTTATDNTLFEADGTIGSGSNAITTNDPDFTNSKQWHLEKINIAPAWNKFNSINAAMVVTVAVIDCGVQINHPDLTNVVNRNYSVDVTQKDSNENYKKLKNLADTPSANGQYTGYHGTKVAGIILAEGNNGHFGAGVASIASDSFYRNTFELMAIKCDNSVDQDRHINKAYLHRAIHYAVSHGAEVINISYSALENDYDGLNADNDNCFSKLRSKIQDALDVRVCVVCAAGNDGKSNNKRYPAAFDGVIGVGAVDYTYNLTSYTNSSTDNVDIVAPSGNKTSAYNMYSITPTTINSNGCAKNCWGTSYATPQVSATLAMMISINYNLTPAQYLTRLKNRGYNPTTLGVNHNFKILNVGNTVAQMVEQ